VEEHTETDDKRGWRQVAVNEFELRSVIANNPVQDGYSNLIEGKGKRQANSQA
jgi:hypothetical protein